MVHKLVKRPVDGVLVHQFLFLLTLRKRNQVRIMFRLVSEVSRAIEDRRHLLGRPSCCCTDEHDRDFNHVLPK